MSSNHLRYTLRALARRPGFTAVAGLTLALAIGGNTVLFGVLEKILLQPLPFPQEEQLCVVREFAHGEPDGVSLPDFVDFRSRSAALRDLAAVRSESLTLTGGGDPERIHGSRVSASYFTLLKVSPLRGRAFLPGEDLPGRDGVVILSEPLWRRRFGADGLILGKPLQLNGRSYTVVGVMPAGIEMPGTQEQLWVPLALNADALSQRGRHNLTVFGRLKPGVRLKDAGADLLGIARRLEQEYPATNTGRGVSLIPLREEIVGSLRPVLLILFGAVTLLLVNACANVASLMIVRVTGRERELGVREALGASRGHLMWLLLSESLVIALAAALGGLGLATAGLGLFRRLAPPDIPRLETVSLDGRSLAFLLGVSLLAGLVCGLAPLLRGRRGLALALHGGRSSRIGRHRLEGLLAVLQVGLALILLIGAGLLIRSYSRLRAVDLGFDPARLLTFRLTLPAAKYEDPGQVARAYREILQRVATLPGARSVSAASYIPLTGQMVSGVYIEGQPPPASAEDLAKAQFRVIDPGYFETMRIELRHGRWFTSADDERAPRVAVVNETMARRWWPDGNPVGKRLAYDFEGSFKTGLRPIWIEVVGVAGDVKHFGLGSEAVPELYIPLGQAGETWSWFNRSLSFVVRTDRDPYALARPMRAAVWGIDPDLPVQDVDSMATLLQRSVLQPRLNTLLLVSFAVLALALAAVGVYGLLAQLVSERTQEIGLRMCLGADRRSVLQLVIGRGLRLVLLGLAWGGAAAFAATRLLSNLLFGVGALDPLTFLGAPLFLLAIALLACYWPARRASRVEPVRALQAE